LPAAVKLKGTSTLDAAIAEFVANPVEAIADAKITF
jgi:hypothetical protein